MPLVDENTLILQQVKSLLRDDFDILDADGSPIATIHTEGSAMSRMFLGSRELTVLEDGRPVLRISDPANFMSRDSYTVSDGAGARLAVLTKEFALFTTRVGIQLSDGTVLNCKGSLFGYDFAIRHNERIAARISRQMPGIAHALMGHDRYVLSMDDALPPAYRGTLIGTVIAIDLIHAKQTARANSGGS